MFYTGYANQKDPVGYKIGYATTTDGVNWGTPQKVPAPDRSIYPFASRRVYSTPNAVILNNQVHLFFDVVYDTTGFMFSQEKIHHAFSVDGVSDWTTDGSALFDRSQFSWSDYGLNGPSVLQDGKNFYIWFGGQGNVSAFPDMNFGNAMATCRL